MTLWSDIRDIAFNCPSADDVIEAPVPDGTSVLPSARQAHREGDRPQVIARGLGPHGEGAGAASRQWLPSMVGSGENPGGRGR